MNGSLSLKDKSVTILSGNSIDEFPENNYLVFANLKSEYDILYNYKSLFFTPTQNLPIFGLFKNLTPLKETGRITIFGDSSCLEIENNNC